MFEEPIEIIIIAVAAMGLMFPTIILFMCRHGVMDAIREKFQKHGVHVWKVYQTGGVEQSYCRPKEKFTFGKGQYETSTFVANRHHFNARTGKPVVVLVEGNPVNVPLNQNKLHGAEQVEGDTDPNAINVNTMFPPQKHSEIVNQAIIRAEQYGVIKTMGKLQGDMNNAKFLLILVLAAAALSGVAAYFGYMNFEALGVGV